MFDNVYKSSNIQIPKLKNYKAFALRSMMRKDGLFHGLAEDPPDPETSFTSVVNRFRREVQKACSQKLLNLGKELATLIS